MVEIHFGNVSRLLLDEMANRSDYFRSHLLPDGPLDLHVTYGHFNYEGYEEDSRCPFLDIPNFLCTLSTTFLRSRGPV